MKLPLASVDVFETVPEGTFVILIVAPATAAPFDVTVPRITAVVSCADAIAGAMSATAATPQNRLLRIDVSPFMP